jgi:coiled-coil domain-containing protein 12
MRKRDAQDGGEDTVEKAVEGLAEAILREDEEKRKEELVRLDLRKAHGTLLTMQDLFNIQPKRANWDLKRDMTNRMAKLDRKTNEAIAGIFRKLFPDSVNSRPLNDQVNDYSR